MRFGIFLSAALLLGCGTNTSGFDTDASLSGDGGINADSPFGFGDSGMAEGGCSNLQCKQTCSSTSISGYVYDPKGTVPLYNVYVYVPNDALAAIPSTVTCEACQAPASGSPVASATTDETGHFSIPNAPIADNIPLVMQLGKWRRVVTLPHIQALQEDKSSSTRRRARKTTRSKIFFACRRSKPSNRSTTTFRKIGGDDRLVRSLHRMLFAQTRSASTRPSFKKADA